MLNNFENFLTSDYIFLVANWGVIPFWLLLIFFPSTSFTKFFVHSIVIPALFSVAYAFIAYKIYLDENIFGGFGLYLGLENLYAVFSDENFLLIFWLHFLAISLFIGSWISRDSLRYSIPKFLAAVCIIITYFTGPLGLMIYWIIRIFFAKKFSLNE